MKSSDITANVKFEYSHKPFDLNKVIEITEKINEILIEVDPTLQGQLSVAKRRSLYPIQMTAQQSKPCR